MRVIPIINAVTLIPRGSYCYAPVAAPTATDMRYYVKTCPFWEKNHDAQQLYGDQMSGYCSYLRTGDWLDGGTDLLWDQVKCCGIKMDDEFDQ